MSEVRGPHRIRGCVSTFTEGAYAHCLFIVLRNLQDEPVNSSFDDSGFDSRLLP